MGAYGGPTAKRHKIWSNCAKLLSGIWEHGGSLSREQLSALPGGHLVKKYTDRLGVKRMVGIKNKLKSSQLLGLFVWGGSADGRYIPRII